MPEPHAEVVTHILGEHIGENMTSVRTPLPARGVYIRVCPKCGDTLTVPKATYRHQWVCSGKGIILIRGSP